MLAVGAVVQELQVDLLVLVERVLVAVVPTMEIPQPQIQEVVAVAAVVERLTAATAAPAS